MSRSTRGTFLSRYEVSPAYSLQASSLLWISGHNPSLDVVLLSTLRTQNTRRYVCFIIIFRKLSLYEEN